MLGSARTERTVGPESYLEATMMMRVKGLCLSYEFSLTPPGLTQGNTWYQKLVFSAHHHSERWLLAPIQKASPRTVGLGAPLATWEDKIDTGRGR